MSASSQVKEFNFDQIVQGTRINTPGQTRALFRCTILPPHYKDTEACMKELAGEGYDYFWKSFDNLSEINHSNLIKLIGFTRGISKWLILPCCILHGSVADYYEKKPIDPYSRGKACKWEKETALGLQYLHSKGLVHGNLKSTQLLIFADETLKITDACLYGTARRANMSSGTASHNRYRYMSTQIANHYNDEDYEFTEWDDIFSFGRCMYLFHAEKEPFGEEQFIQVSPKLKANVPPEIPDFFRSQAKDVMTACWRTIPTDRPYMINVVERLEELVPSIDRPRDINQISRSLSREDVTALARGIGHGFQEPSTAVTDVPKENQRVIEHWLDNLPTYHRQYAAVILNDHLKRLTLPADIQAIAKNWDY